MKMGRHEETVDIQLNQEAAKFKAHYKHLEKINDDAKKFMTLMKGNCLFTHFTEVTF
mgnify:CR=1 FL=1